MEEEAEAPGGLFVGRVVPCLPHQTQPGGTTVPMEAPSVRLSVHPRPQPGRAGWLAVMVCVCVCVLFLGWPREKFYITFKRTPLGLLLYF